MILFHWKKIIFEFHRLTQNGVGLKILFIKNYNNIEIFKLKGGGVAGLNWRSLFSKNHSFFAFVIIINKSSVINLIDICSTLES